ncbi:MAG TPA: hypothetical protein VNG53_05805 [Bacteroidia bacterium]|nr:hypothetical protein [Bacteroidia bacterium]
MNKYTLHIIALFAFVLIASCGEKKSNNKILSYYPNGKIKEERAYPNSKDSSWYLSYLYTPEGFLKFKATVHDSIANGPATVYYSNGKIKELQYYINDSLNGLFIDFDSIGRIKKYAYYKDGKLDGLSTSYFSNGNIEESCNYKDDKKQGFCVYYYRNGNIGSFSNCDMDKINGRLSIFYPTTGKLHQYLLLHEGIPIWGIEYDTNGNLKIYGKVKSHSKWSRKELVHHILYDE